MVLTELNDGVVEGFELKQGKDREVQWVRGTLGVEAGGTWWPHPGCDLCIGDSS